MSRYNWSLKKTERGAEAGILIAKFQARKSQKISNECKVFQAGVYARLVAAEILLEANVKGTFKEADRIATAGAA